MTSLTRQAHDLSSAGASVQTITTQLKLPPSRLKRIINSPSEELARAAKPYQNGGDVREKLSTKYKTVQSGTEWYRCSKS